MSIQDLIAQDTEAPPVAPGNDVLAQISELAEKQLKVLGHGKDGHLKQAPSGSIISELLSWGKKQGVPVVSLTPVKDASIAELVGALITRYAEYRTLSENLIPAALAAVGMKAFQLADGTGIQVEDDLAVSGTWGDRQSVPEGAMKFLDSIGCGDVVKGEVKITLGKGETEKSHELLVLAEQLGLPATEKLSIHSATLKSLVKEQQSRGVEFPPEFFSIFRYQKTMVKI